MKSLMKHSAIAALALLGTTAALAQSSVTLYGRINVSAEHQKEGNASATAMANNASRIGFKGVEDLGGGMTAGFQFESGIDPAPAPQTATPARAK